MLSSKQIYCMEHERLTAEAEDAGMDWTAAYEATSEAAWDAARDRMADMADELRQRSKEPF